MGLTTPKIRQRLVREQKVSALFGLFTFSYKVHAFEDQEQVVFYYVHVIQVKFWSRAYAWNFRDALPRYELPVESHES